ncbi:MAG: D-alanine--D-alanine ligase, partial [Deltaproteobacteria bacterium]|nr:D-alanine--D-alanine ligase [Deltaproteobacteria bacterium]
MKWKHKKIGVLMGGISKEREVSLRTGTAVFEALKRKGYNAIAIDVGADLVLQLQKNPIDAAFIALHGVYGEDGCIQGLLEWLKIPYTGSGVLASALAFDKAVLNNLVRQLGVVVPKEIVFDSRHHNLDDFLSMVPGPWSMVPAVVKPSREGSTINISIVREAASLKGAVQLALQSDCKVLIEEYIKGKEVTVAVLN